MRPIKTIAWRRRLNRQKAISAMASWSLLARPLVPQAAPPSWLQKGLTSTEAQVPLPAGSLPLGFGGASTGQSPDETSPSPSQRSRGE